MNQRKKILYKTLLLFIDETITFNQTVSWGNPKWETVNILLRRGYLDSLVREGKDVTYFITEPGHDFLENYIKDRNKILWDIIKFISGYVLGGITGYLLWLFTHKCP